MEHDFEGMCAPGGPDEYGPKTFSLGIFEVIPKKSGIGTKRGKVKARVGGYSNNPGPVYKRARQIVALLNAGEYDGPKTVWVNGGGRRG
jgi:hypothetical protein